MRIEQRRRRLALTRLMVDASLKVQTTVGVLSPPKTDTHQVRLVQIGGGHYLLDDKG